MDLIEKYLGEKDSFGRDFESWKRRFKQKTNPYVGKYFGDLVIFFHKYDPNSNIDKVFIWNGKKWMNMNNVNKPENFTYGTSLEANKELKNAVLNLKKKGEDWTKYII